LSVPILPIRFIVISLKNKGLFVPGATDIPVYDKDGKLVGRLDKAPMADFSSVSSNGVATLVSPQYIVSVKHNGGYQSVSFGNGKNTYSLVDRNNHSSVDIHIPGQLTMKDNGLFCPPGQDPVFYCLNCFVFVRANKFPLSRVIQAVPPQGVTIAGRFQNIEAGLAVEYHAV